MPIHPAYGARVEKETATHSSILAWRIPWTEEPGRLQPMGLKESNTTEQLNSDMELGGGKGIEK